MGRRRKWISKSRKNEIETEEANVFRWYVLKLFLFGSTI